MLKLMRFCLNFLNIQKGVPQGSILGPLLFIAFINDIVQIKGSLNIILYADDCVIFGQGKDLDILRDRLQGGLDRVLRWIWNNKLKLNEKNNDLIIFGTKYCSEM